MVKRRGGTGEANSREERNSKAGKKLKLLPSS